MAPAIPLIVLAALALVAIRRLPPADPKRKWETIGSQLDEIEDNERETRRAISVNLDILLGEIYELQPIANESKPSAEVDDAKSLLQKAATTAEQVENQLRASFPDLSEILGTVFAAMEQSRQARILLGACHGPVQE